MEARWWSDLLGGRRAQRKTLRRNESTTGAPGLLAGVGPDGAAWRG